MVGGWHGDREEMLLGRKRVELEADGAQERGGIAVPITHPILQPRQPNTGFQNLHQLNRMGLIYSGEG